MREQVLDCHYEVNSLDLNPLRCADDVKYDLSIKYHIEDQHRGTVHCPMIRLAFVWVGTTELCIQS